MLLICEASKFRRSRAPLLSFRSVLLWAPDYVLLIIWASKFRKYCTFPKIPCSLPPSLQIFSKICCTSKNSEDSILKILQILCSFSSLKILKSLSALFIELQNFQKITCSKFFELQKSFLRFRAHLAVCSLFWHSASWEFFRTLISADSVPGFWTFPRILFSRIPGSLFRFRAPYLLSFRFSRDTYLSGLLQECQRGLFQLRFAPSKFGLHWYNLSSCFLSLLPKNLFCPFIHKFKPIHLHSMESSRIDTEIYESHSLRTASATAFLDEEFRRNFS